MAGRRLSAYYVLLAVAATAVTVVVLAAGSKSDPQPAIAGGYDVAAGRACLGEQVDVRQSGQFLALQHSDGSSVGKPRFEDGRLDGTVECTDGRSARLDATVR